LTDPKKSTIIQLQSKHSPKPGSSWLSKCVYVLPLLLLLVGCGWSLWILWAGMLSEPKYHIPVGSLKFNSDLPMWDEARAEIEKIASQAEGRSILDTRLIPSLREAFLASPWVVSAEINRHFPNRLSIQLDLRNPSLQVLSGGYYWLVSSDGRLLSGHGLSERREGIVTLFGVKSYKPFVNGKWQDESVIGALMLIERFSEVDCPVEAIWVKRNSFKKDGKIRETRPYFLIRFVSGVEVYWGLCNIDDLQGEMTFMDKWSMIQKVKSIPGLWKRGLRVDVSTRVGGYWTVSTSSVTNSN